MFGKFSIFKTKHSADASSETEQSSFMICPSCGDEYRSEFKHCDGCDVELVSDQEYGSRNTEIVAENTQTMTITKDDSLVLLRRGSLQDMKTAQRLLKKTFIASLLREPEGSSKSGCCNAKQFDLIIKEEDAATAFAILADDFRQTTDLANHDYGEGAEAVYDPSLLEATCPACGSTFRSENGVCPECGLCLG